jgi:hypothetical protein
LFLGAVLAYVITRIVTVAGGIPFMGYFWPLCLLLTAALALIMLLVRWSERLLSRPLPGLRFGLAAVLVVGAGFALTRLANDHQRCVSRASMTVVAASLCQNAGGQAGGGRGPYIWYYGGSGTQVGDSAHGGSPNPPADDGGGGGGVGGGDDGGDGGDGGGGGDG